MGRIDRVCSYSLALASPGFAGVIWARTTPSWETTATSLPALVYNCGENVEGSNERIAPILRFGREDFCRDVEAYPAMDQSTTHPRRRRFHLLIPVKMSWFYTGRFCWAGAPRIATNRYSQSRDRKTRWHGQPWTGYQAGR